MTKVDFPSWLKEQIELRRWSQLKFAEKGGITASQVSHVLNGQRKPGEDFFNATAKALSMPVVEVYKIAGVIPETDKPLTADVRRLAVILEELTADERAQVIDFAEFLRLRKR